MSPQWYAPARKMKYRICTTAEAASHGQASGAGNGSHTATAMPTIPAPTEMATVSSCLSEELFSSAFQEACRSAAPSTASVTGSESSVTQTPPKKPALADDLVEERR